MGLVGESGPEWAQGGEWEGEHRQRRASEVKQAPRLLQALTQPWLTVSTDARRRTKRVALWSEVMVRWRRWRGCYGRLTGGWGSRIEANGPDSRRGRGNDRVVVSIAREEHDRQVKSTEMLQKPKDWLKRE